MWYFRYWYTLALYCYKKLIVKLFCYNNDRRINMIRIPSCCLLLNVCLLYSVLILYANTIYSNQFTNSSCKHYPQRADSNWCTPSSGAKLVCPPKDLKKMWMGFRTIFGPISTMEMSAPGRVVYFQARFLSWWWMLWQ